jgi:hypothetical protein
MKAKSLFTKTVTLFRDQKDNFVQDRKYDNWYVQQNTFNFNFILVDSEPEPSMQETLQINSMVVLVHQLISQPLLLNQLQVFQAHAMTTPDVETPQ